VTKFSWEPLDGGSILLKVADGDRETTWKITKRTPVERVSTILYEASAATTARKNYVITPVRALEAPLSDVQPISDQEPPEDAERASRAAQAARVAQLNAGAQWFNADDDTYGVPIPDYDSGEIQ
jgi:hypothetical protein